MAAVQSTYKAIWEKDDQYSSLEEFAALPVADNELFGCPVSHAEEVQILKKMKATSAPGPDGVSRAELFRWDPSEKKIANLFNTILLNGKLLRYLKESRTVLLPKGPEGEQSTNIGDWRPITLSLILLCTLSAIIERRLREACPPHPSQVGFINTQGCSENLTMLDGIIGVCKKERRDLVVLFMDMAIAFDWISHKLIDELLSQEG